MMRHPLSTSIKLILIQGLKMSNTPLNVKTFGYKEINQIDAQKKYINNINIFVKFFYLDINRKKIIESDIYILDKDFFLLFR